MLITNPSELKQFYADKRVWQGIPSIERTKNGRLFSTFYSGRDRETLGNYCMLLVSDDDGKTWSEPIAVAYAGTGYRCFDSVVWIDPLGRLWFIWNRGADGKVFGVTCDNPDAKELVWSEEFYIGDGVIMQKPTVLSSGEWLFPIYIMGYHLQCGVNDAFGVVYEKYSPEMIEKRSSETGANVYKTVDNGKTFSLLGGCSWIPGRHFDEHMVYEKRDGTVVMMTRTTYGIGISWSYDGGKTWTLGENSGIAGPCSRFHVRRLKSGRLLLVNHDASFEGRNKLAAFLSEDDGETWPYELMLDERDNVSYPDMAEGDDGTLYITYDHERGSFQSSLEDAQKCAREILFAKVTEADILAGKIVSPESKLKQVICKLGEYTGTEDFYRQKSPLDVDRLLSFRPNGIRLLEEVFVYYPFHCANLHCVDMKKLNTLVMNIETGVGDLRANLSELIAMLIKAEKEAKKVSDVPVVGRVIDTLQKNLTNPVDLNTIAQEIGVNVYYLCHIFKKRTGLSVLEYRNVCRMAKAKQLLVQTDLPISRICEQCGFGDASYFASKFRENEGVSPSAYRNLNQTK